MERDPQQRAPPSVIALAAQRARRESIRRASRSGSADADTEPLITSDSRRSSSHMSPGSSHLHAALWAQSKRSLGYFSGSQYSMSIHSSSSSKLIIAPTGIDRVRQELAVAVIESHYLRVVRWSPAHLLGDGSAGVRPDWGLLCFVGRAVRGSSEVATARYLRTPPHVAPSRLARLMAKYWKLRRAAVCVLGSGVLASASAAEPPSAPSWSPHLVRLMARGLAAAVRATGAFVMCVSGSGATAGLSAMLMAAAAEADPEHGAAAGFPLVGFIPWAQVKNRHRLAQNAGSSEPRPYPLETASALPAHERAIARHGRQLEPHHTHLVLLDGQTRGDGGGEGGGGGEGSGEEGDGGGVLGGGGGTERSATAVALDSTLESYCRIYDAPCAVLVLGGDVSISHSALMASDAIWPDDCMLFGLMIACYLA